MASVLRHRGRTGETDFAYFCCIALRSGITRFDINSHVTPFLTFHAASILVDEREDRMYTFRRSMEAPEFW